MAGSALALLIVKPPNSTGPVRISEAPSAITDIPATIVDTLGLKNPFSGTSAMKLDEPRRGRASSRYICGARRNGRRIFSRTWTCSPWMGKSSKATSGRPRSLFTRRRRRRNNARADSIVPSEAVPARYSGGARPLAYLHQPADARGVELKVRSAADGPQTLTVEMRGKVIDTRVLSDHEWHSLSYSIPPSTGTPAGGEWVVLRVNPPWKVRGDRRTFGVMTRDLKWIN